jgi:DNA-binding transcriptional ArsR family regulator
MPTTPLDNVDLRDLIHINESAAYELLLSLGALYWMPPRHRAWAERARTLLGPEWMAEVRFFHEDFWSKLALMELPVDYPGPAHDAAGFIDYVAGLDADSFLFYLFGRVIPRAEMAAVRAEPEGIAARIANFYELLWPGSSHTHMSGDMMPRVAAEPAQIQQRLVALLRFYYDAVFAAELPALKRHWAASIADKRQALARQDATTFLNRLLTKSALPPMFPEDMPLARINVIPSYYIWRSNFEIWGYGSVNILFNALATEERDEERGKQEASISQVAAALSDTNRLRILAAITQDPEVYGHKLARMCGISQPAVSRHMGILKRAGLVEEVPTDGRVLYRLCRPVLEDFLPQVLRYLEG